MSRKWYPDILIDEYLPDGRPSAEAWLEPDENGRTDVHFNVSLGIKPVATWSPGDVVKFRWCEPHGTLTLSIMPDGAIASPLRCPETPDMFDGTLSAAPTDVISAEVNTFSDEDGAIIASSINEFAMQYVDAMEGWMHDDGDLVVVFICHWSAPLSFTISADGKSLTPISPEVPNHVHG